MTRVSPPQGREAEGPARDRPGLRHQRVLAIPDEAHVLLPHQQHGGPDGSRRVLARPRGQGEPRGGQGPGACPRPFPLLGAGRVCRRLCQHHPLLPVHVHGRVQLSSARCPHSGGRWGAGGSCSDLVPSVLTAHTLPKECAQGQMLWAPLRGGPRRSRITETVAGGAQGGDAGLGGSVRSGDRGSVWEDEKVLEEMQWWVNHHVTRT